jgi:hypothetical protein
LSELFSIEDGTIIPATPFGANSCFARSIKKHCIFLFPKSLTVSRSSYFSLISSSRVSKKSSTAKGGLATKQSKLCSLISL